MMIPFILFAYSPACAKHAGRRELAKRKRCGAPQGQ